jgi:hypothetical protein
MLIWLSKSMLNLLPRISLTEHFEVLGFGTINYKSRMKKESSIVKFN